VLGFIVEKIVLGVKKTFGKKQTALTDSKAANG
jgi:hypothetical protein